MFLKMFKFDRKTPVTESVFDKAAALKACNFIKKNSQFFSDEICKIVKNTYFEEHLQTTASDFWVFSTNWCRILGRIKAERYWIEMRKPLTMKKKKFNTDTSILQL